jgi:starch synthase
MIASEVSPWAKTGGLADVVAALPAALESLGHAVTLVLPRYGAVKLPDGTRVECRVGLGTVRHDVVLHVSPLSARRRVVFVDIPALFDRPDMYATGGIDYPDNAERFAVFAAAALEFAVIDSALGPVDVIHAHDWQAGLVPVLVQTHARYRQSLRDTGLVFTVHNLTHQGVFDRDVVPRLGLPWSVFTISTAEYWGRFSFLKAALTASDLVTTVSPTYARETRTPEAGFGLDGVLAALADRYVGLLNGIDVETWNPATDPLLPARFDRHDLGGKLVCKRALLERFRLPVGDDAMARPVVAMVSRLVWQKGLDLVRAAADELVELDASWIFVGAGDPGHEQFLRDLAARFPARVGVHIGFDDPLAHLVEAGADLFLMPSVFEPCGLNQMYSLRYGTVPVVTAVGGLDDTVRPYTARARHANGFKFREHTPEALVRALRQALRLYRDTAVWQQLMVAGMTLDHSWQTSAREYVKVYRRARQLAPTRREL